MSAAEVVRLSSAWPCPACGGSAARYAANHAADCWLRSALAALNAAVEGWDASMCLFRKFRL